MIVATFLLLVCAVQSVATIIYSILATYLTILRVWRPEDVVLYQQKRHLAEAAVHVFVKYRGNC